MAWTLCDDGQGHREGLFTGSATIWATHVTLRLCQDGRQAPRRPWSPSPVCPAPRPSAHSTGTSLRCRDVPSSAHFQVFATQALFSTRILERVVCKRQGRADDKGLGDSEQKIGVPGGRPRALSCIPRALSCIPRRRKRLLPVGVRGPLPTPTVGEASTCSAHLNTEVGPWSSCWWTAGARCGGIRLSGETTLVPDGARAQQTPERPVPG